jgi:hypothetical protein
MDQALIVHMVNGGGQMEADTDHVAWVEAPFFVDDLSQGWSLNVL